MKIAINCWILRNKNPDGIGNVIIETIPLLIRNHPELHFMILCDKNFKNFYFDFPNVSHHYIFPPFRHPVLYMWYMDFVLPGFLKKQKADIFVGMDGFISLRSKVPQLGIIHDLNFEHYPKDLPIRNRLYYRFYFKRFACKAKLLLAVSNFTRNDIIKTYQIPAEKISVLTLGAKNVFTALSINEIVHTRDTWSSGQAYFFFVGSMHRRKNIVRLLQAFDAFKIKNQSKTKLILAGNIMWQHAEIKNELQRLQFKNDIIFTGRVPDESLKLLLGSAKALVFVPIFEGFGLPIVEAFQAGVPVICSNTSSMPEVAGDAALLIDPFDINDIAGAMYRIDNNEELQHHLIEKGNVQKLKFNWQNTADELYQAILKTVGV